MGKFLLLIVPVTVALAAAGCDSEETGGEANGCTSFSEATEVKFGGDLGNAYDPACVQVKTGASMTWTGDFSGHFLVGGTADDEGLHSDASSPIGKTTTGTSVTVSFPEPGTYPYYCEQHGTIGMVGAVFVE